MGNKKQFKIIQRLQVENQNAKAIYAPYRNAQGEKHLNNTTDLLDNRVKMLRIADSSVHSWATVVEYKNNPVAVDEEDDRKLRRAEKSTLDKKQLKEQDKKARQSRFSPYGYNHHNNNTATHHRVIGPTVLEMDVQITTRPTEGTRATIHTGTVQWHQTNNLHVET